MRELTVPDSTLQGVRSSVEVPPVGVPHGDSRSANLTATWRQVEAFPGETGQLIRAAQVLCGADSEWKNIKVVLRRPVERKRAFWLGWNTVESRWARNRDCWFAAHHCPALLDAALEILNASMP